MTDKSDIKFINSMFIIAIANDHPEILRGFLDNISKMDKYEIVNFEDESGGEKQRIKLNKLIFLSIHTAHIYRSAGCMRMLLEYAIKTYNGDPQSGVALDDIIYNSANLLQNEDFCNKIIDANLISEDEHDKMMEISSKFLTYYHQDSGVIRLLELTSKHINNYNEKQHSYLYEAINHSRLNVVKLLTENGARLDMEVALSDEYKGMSPLEFAIYCSNDDIIEYIRDTEHKRTLSRRIEFHKAKLKKIKQRNIPKIRGFKL